MKFRWLIFVVLVVVLAACEDDETNTEQVAVESDETKEPEVVEDTLGVPEVIAYSALELEGRDIYIREGCYNCHVQMARPFENQVQRYGEYSKHDEFVYDHPFQWGSKREGPGGRQVAPDTITPLQKEDVPYWLFMKLMEPRLTDTTSIMPAYPWLMDDMVNESLTKGKIEAMQVLGVPYSSKYPENCVRDMRAQARGIALQILEKDTGDYIHVDEAQLIRSEAVALVAYMTALRDAFPTEISVE